MRKAIGRILLLLALLVPLGNPVAAASVAPQVRIAIPQDEGAPNPYTYITGYPGHNLLLLVFDTLFQLDANNMPTPWLVKEYQVSPDGTTWTLRLHENVKWHDGQPLTAEDVKFTFEYVLTKEGTHSRWTPPSKVIRSITVPDKHTVVFTLSRPAPSFALRPLADVPILPKHIWENQMEPSKFMNSIGSGPYRVVERKEGQFYRLEAVKDYFKGPPQVQTLVFPIIKDTTAMFTALKAGEVDAAARALPPELVEQFRAAGNLKLYEGPSFASTMLLFNAERPPFNKREFRQAVSLAINKKQLVDTLLLGRGIVANPGFVHPELPWANPDLKPQYDPAQARRILDDLGFKDRDGDGLREDPGGQKLDLTLLAQSNNPVRVRAAELIADMLKQVGIKVTVRAMDPAAVDNLVWPEYNVAKGRNFDMAMWGWSAPVQLDPAMLGTLVHSDPIKGSINLGGIKQADLDAVADRMATAVNWEQLLQLNRELQTLIAREVPFVPLFFPTDAFAVNARVYDGWVYTKGQGILGKLSFVPAGAGPAAGQPAAGQRPNGQNQQPAAGGTNLALLLGVVAMVAIGLFALRRRVSK